MWGRGHGPGQPLDGGTSTGVMMGWGMGQTDDGGTSMGGYDAKIFLSSELAAAVQGMSHSLKNWFKNGKR